MTRAAVKAPSRQPSQRSKSVITGQWHTPYHGPPPTFRSDADAIQWAIGQGINQTLAAQRLAELRRQFNRHAWAYFLGWAAMQMRGW